MALPELLANSPTPGTRQALTTLATELSEAGATLKLTGALPAALQGPGQLRVVIGSEVLLLEATSETTVKILTRGAEGSVKAAHAAGTLVFHFLTAGALSAYTKPEFVSALPSAPFDGQVIYFQNAAMAEQGVVWAFRYRAASSSGHKWEFIGGSELYSTTGVVSQTSAVAFQAQSPNTACAISLPVAGVYEVMTTLWLVNGGSTMNFEPVLANVATPTVTIIGMASAVTLPGAGAEYATLDSFVRVELGAIAITPAIQMSGAGQKYEVITEAIRVRPVRV